MDNILKLKRTLDERTKALIKPTTVWATVKETDWGTKTMTATGILDGLDYFDVLLGIGNSYRNPAKGAKVLIGQLEGQDAAWHLIECENAEEAIINVGTCSLTMTPEGFELKKGGESLTKIMADLMQCLLQLTVTTGTGPSGPPINSAQLQQINNRLKDFLI